MLSTKPLIKRAGSERIHKKKLKVIMYIAELHVPVKALSFPSCSDILHTLVRDTLHLLENFSLIHCFCCKTKSYFLVSIKIIMQTQN